MVLCEVVLWSFRPFIRGMVLMWRPWLCAALLIHPATPLLYRTACHARRWCDVIRHAVGEHPAAERGVLCRTAGDDRRQRAVLHRLHCFHGMCWVVFVSDHLHAVLGSDHNGSVRARRNGLHEREARRVSNVDTATAKLAKARDLDVGGWQVLSRREQGRWEPSSSAHGASFAPLLMGRLC